MKGCLGVSPLRGGFASTRSLVADMLPLKPAEVPFINADDKSESAKCSSDMRLV